MRITFVACMLLVGCGASATQVSGPDGSHNWYSITCRRNQSNCIEKAGEVCPRGYVTADSDGRTQLVANELYVAEAYNGEMLVKCR